MSIDCSTSVAADCINKQHIIENFRKEISINVRPAFVVKGPVLTICEYQFIDVLPNGN